MKILITGITGSGKTSLALKLNKLGYTAYDGDKRTSLGRWVDFEGKPVRVPNRLTKDWIKRHMWNWDRQQMIKLLNQHNSVFVCGTSSNQHEMYDLFDTVLLLTVSKEEMLRRLNSRPWGFGKFSQEQMMVLEWHKGYDDFHASFGVIKIDANRPLSVTLRDVVSLVKEKSREKNAGRTTAALSATA